MSEKRDDWSLASELAQHWSIVQGTLPMVGNMKPQEPKSVVDGMGVNAMLPGMLDPRADGDMRM